MTAYEAGFLSRMRDLGVSAGDASRMLCKSAFAGGHGAELLGAALGAGTGYLMSRKEDGKRRNWLLNTLLGASLGGLGAFGIRKYVDKGYSRSAAEFNDAASGSLGKGAPDIQSLLRGSGTSEVRNALGLEPNERVTHRHVAEYLAKTHPGIDPDEVSDTRSATKYDTGSPSNMEVYEYRLAQQADLVDRLRAMGVPEETVAAAASAFAKATARNIFDYRPARWLPATPLGLRQVREEIDRAKGEAVSRAVSGG